MWRSVALVNESITMASTSGRGRCVGCDWPTAAVWFLKYICKMHDNGQKSVNDRLADVDSLERTKHAPDCPRRAVRATGPRPRLGMLRAHMTLRGRRSRRHQTLKAQVSA